MQTENFQSNPCKWPTRSSAQMTISKIFDLFLFVLARAHHRGLWADAFFETPGGPCELGNIKTATCFFGQIYFAQ